jgi:MarR-like DNA-binding transcriptional regulator SgrR of sgrS sRNA
VLVLVAGVARAEAPPPYGGRAVASLPSAPSSLDPLAAQSAAEVTLAELLFDPLYRLDDAGRPRPQLAAAEPAVSKDLLSARIPLRDGLVYHDGTPVRAGDVAASLARARSFWALAPVRTVTIEAGQIVLGLRRPTPELTTLLAQPQLAVTPGGRAPGATPIGTGPFRLRRADAHAVVLEAFAEHGAGRPFLDGLTLRWFTDATEEARAYEAGEADLSLRGAVAFSGHEPKYPTVVHEGPATVLTFIGFGRPDSADYRRAVSAAMNRAALRWIGTGETVVPTTTPVAAGAPAEAAAPLRADHPLELVVDRSRPDDVDVATRVLAALDRAGVVASYVALAPAEYARRVADGACDLYIGQLVAAPGGSAPFFAAFAAAHDDTLARKLAAAEIVDPAASFAARRPIVPLFLRALRTSHRKTLGGVAFDAAGLIDWADVYLWTGVEP